MPNKLKPIKPKRISDQVFEQLRDLIFRWELKPGDKIMTERDLSEAFGVSRTSVRDAINKLVVMGLLEQKQGQGTFVRSPAGGDQAFLARAMESQNASLMDLFEVRMGLECNAAALAAQRALDTDLKALADCLTEMEIKISAGHLGEDADTTFHMAVSYATQNSLQVYLMKRFYDFLFYGIKESLLRLYEKKENCELIFTQHREIYRAIKNHDPEQAHLAMKQHITYAQNYLRQVLDSDA